MPPLDDAAGAGQPGPSNMVENVACPFCGLVCDDLSLGVDDRTVRVLKNGCSRATAGFERDVAAAKPQIAGRDVDLKAAIKAAADLIRGSRLPLFGGLGTDVDGMRAVMSIADRSGGVVDHALSEGQYRNFKVLQTSGWFMTTLTEARNRADLFVIVGTDVHKLHPRFFERIVCAPESMFSANPPKRSVVFLGKGLDTSAATGDRIGDVLTLPCPPERVGEVAAALRAILNGTPIHADTIAEVPRAEIEALAARIKAATYGVFVWAPPGLAFPNADLTVHTVSELVKDLNKETGRYAGLSLGGNEGAVTAGAVCAWQSGFPLRVSYASGKPHYDPQNYTAPLLIANKETDCVVWIASYTPDIAPPATDIATIVIGTPGVKTSATPAVYIPVGTPGADHKGLIVRCDNVVSLPLKDLGRSSLPRAADILAAIEAAL